MGKAFAGNRYREPQAAAATAAAAAAAAPAATTATTAVAAEERQGSLFTPGWRVFGLCLVEEILVCSFGSRESFLSMTTQHRRSLARPVARSVGQPASQPATRPAAPAR